MSSEDDTNHTTASQGGEEEFKDAAAQAEGEEKEEEKIPTPLPSRFLSREVTGMSQTRLVKVCSWGTICGPVIKTDTLLR